MTDTASAAPSDAEIDAQWRESVEKHETTAAFVRDFARTVLAKWGQPPAVVGDMPAWQQGFLTTMNQDPYPALGGWFVQFWEGADVAARVYGNDAETLRRRCAAITTPQPSQAQAGVEPLTDEQIVGVMHSIPINAAPSYHIAFARAIEQAHGMGIKKGGSNA